MAYLKTQKGWDEIAATHRNLNFRQRQVLILIDGKRTRQDLAVMLRHPDLDESLALLLQQGYIGDTDAANSFFAVLENAGQNASAASIPAINTEPVLGSSGLTGGDTVQNPLSSARSAATVALVSSQQTEPIEASAPAGAEQTAPVAEAQSETESDAEKIDQVRQIIVASIDAYLGILGKPLKQKVASAEPGHQLMQVISQWHIAMCESKRGREVEAELMAKIKALLGGTQS